MSYGSVADQVTALRLQALGAVNGLTIYVPAAYTRRLPYKSVPRSSTDAERHGLRRQHCRFRRLDCHCRGTRLNLAACSKKKVL